MFGWHGEMESYCRFSISTPDQITTTGLDHRQDALISQARCPDITGKMPVPLTGSLWNKQLNQ